MTDDEKLSQRYRELGHEEPPRALDDAILAASRRAAETRPAPLVVPSGRQRWYFPLAAAAIIVLAVAVTMHVEREQPSEEIQEFVPDPKPAPAPEQRVQRDAGPPVEAPKAPPPAAAAAPVDATSAARESSVRAEAARAPQAMRRAGEASREDAGLSSLAKASPEQWLLGIEDLKRQGRHEEAEKQLAEFRKRYPNYRIPEAITEKFETR